jgi:hypothetical protein
MTRFIPTMRKIPMSTLFLDANISLNKMIILKLLDLGIKVDATILRRFRSNEILFAATKTFGALTLYNQSNVLAMKDEDLVDEIVSIPNLKLPFGYVNMSKSVDYDSYGDPYYMEEKDFEYFWFKAVGLDVFDFRFLPVDFRENKNIVTAFMRKHPRRFASLSVGLRANKEFVLKVLGFTPDVWDRRYIQFELSMSLDEDEEIVEKVEFGNRVARFDRIKTFDKLLDINFNFK